MQQTRERGLVGLLIVIVIGLIILGYFGFNIQEILAKPIVHDNLVYFWNLLKALWSNFLAGPAIWVWEHIIKFFWDLFLQGLGNLGDGQGASELMQQ
ncbi:MAG: hypothetical protein AAB458_00245 [Patescibacteria group bacterium]